MAKRKKAEAQPGLFQVHGECQCERCKIRCRIATVSTPAEMLRRSAVPNGLCVNCAVHDFLRNTYPCNMLLAQSGPRILLHGVLREQFAAIMETGHSHARPDEINWNLIVANWDLSWPHGVKPSATNPCSQKELDRYAQEGRKPYVPPKPDPPGGKEATLLKLSATVANATAIWDGEPSTVWLDPPGGKEAIG